MPLSALAFYMHKHIVGGIVLNLFLVLIEVVYIFQSYGQSFLQPDIAVFRQNLESLEKLNTKWKLYRKVGISGVLRGMNTPPREVTLT